MDNPTQDIQDTETLPKNLTESYLSVDIVPSGSQYSREDRIRAVIQYLVTGNLNKTSRMINIPERTLYDWYKTEWWQELTTKIHEENKSELNAGYNRILKRSIEVIEDKLEDDGISIMDAAKVHGILFDKKQLLNNAPTSISNNVTSEHLDKLKAMFEAQTGKLIDGEVVKD